MSSLGCGNNKKSNFKMSNAGRKSARSSDADQTLLCSRKKLKQEKPSTGIPISDPGNSSGISKVFGTDESSPKGQENVGSSGKRKHSRWDATSQADEQNVDDGVVIAKRRKTRWANDDSQLKMLGPILLPDFVKGSTAAASDPRFQELYQRLIEINQELQSQEPIGARDACHHEKLIKEKQEIIKKLIQKNPTFDVPSEIKQQKLYKKLYIPVKEYPEYNFIGLILGPRGNTQKRMETETGARILLRGKGSKIHAKDAKQDPSDDDDLHVLVEADSQKSLDAAVALVEKLLVPVEDGKNELKLSQLRELAKLNNRLRGENTHTTGEIASKTDGPFKICGDSGHHYIACTLTAPLKGSKKNEYKCETCGDVGHHAIACPFSGTLLGAKTNENNASFLASVGGGFSSFISPSPLGNQSFDFGSAFNSVPFTGDKFSRDVNYANLYVGHLPPYVDEGRLVQLFSPFGALADAQVIRDKATGLSQGYGFLKYADPSNATMAVNQMNGYRMEGKTLVVRVASSHQHGTPGSVQAVDPTSISFLPAYPSSSAVSAHIPAPTCWPGPPGSMLPGTYDLRPISYSSPYISPVPASLISTHATPEELARFPGNPDNFPSDRSSLFS